MRTSLPGVKARQDFVDRPAFVVLIVSCALVILFLGFAAGQLFPKWSRWRPVHRGDFSLPNAAEPQHRRNLLSSEMLATTASDTDMATY
jgi:hypothetical protein